MTMPVGFPPNELHLQRQAKKGSLQEVGNNNNKKKDMIIFFCSSKTTQQTQRHWLKTGSMYCAVGPALLPVHRALCSLFQPDTDGTRVS